MYLQPRVKRIELGACSMQAHPSRAGRCVLIAGIPDLLPDLDPAVGAPWSQSLLLRAITYSSGATSDRPIHRNRMIATSLHQL